jgi:glycosyltransferase involved in cell wall biosynthesis
MKLSIIIPVYNEEKTLQEIVKKVDEVSVSPSSKEIVIVDDASSDTTPQILETLQKKYKDLTVITHKLNAGKGAAVRTGMKKATGDYIVIQDADLEYDPKDLKRLFSPIQQNTAKVVYGTRLKRLPNLKKEESRPRFLIHYLGNRFLSFVTSMLYGQWITDMETCYKIFPRSFIQTTQIKGNGFNFEPEITAKLIKAGYKIVELPIKTTPRGYEEGKKLQTIPEGIEALKTLFRYKFVD